MQVYLLPQQSTAPDALLAELQSLTGCTARLGIGSCRLVAGLAASLSAPAGVSTLDAHTVLAVDVGAYCAAGTS